MGMLFERRDGVEGEFLVGGHLHGGAGDDHGREGFVSAEEVFGDGAGDGDEVGFEVIGVLDEERGGHDVGEGFVGEISSEGNRLLAMWVKCRVWFGVVERSRYAHVCFLWSEVRFVLIWL